MNANSRQVGGEHYKGAIQHWDYALLALENRYLEGNVTKYVARHRKKNGAQDLEKAQHYLDKLIESAPFIRSLGYIMASAPIHQFIERFCEDNELNTFETAIMVKMARWNKVDDLRDVRLMIDELTERMSSGEEPGPGYTNQG